METEEKKWCIYIHRNKINNKAYIGITNKKPEYRWGKNGSGYKNNKHFYRAIEKYGWDNFEHIIWANELSQIDALHIESLLISLYCTANQEYGYNISINGSFGHTGIKHSEETKAKIGQKSKERLKDLKNHPTYNKKHSEETKQKQREAALNRRHSNETKKKLSQNKINKRRNKDEDFITICQYNKQGLLIENFYGVTFASEKTGISRSAISNCLNGLSKTAGGYIWKYSNEQLTNDYIEYVNSRKNRNIKNKNYEILNTERK